jgi:hypothetical protein
VKKDVDCQVFEDQLDAFMDGALPEEGIGQLRLHAQSCEDCAMLIRVKEHLALPSLEELEAAVPETLLGSLWPRIEAEAKEDLRGVSPAFRSTVSRVFSSGRSAATDMRPGVSAATFRDRPGTWLIPSLAAASMALLFSTGFLFSEVRRVEDEGSRLVEQVEDLQWEIRALDMRTEWVERTAQLAGRRRSEARTLDYLLIGKESVTVAALVDLLEMYPADRVLFEAGQVEGLLGTSIRRPQELRDVLSILADAITALENPEEIRAGELAEWLAASLPAETVLPKSSLLELLS